jgi:hypothetical protein
MMAAFIFVVSLAALFMFFVSYCRSLTASSSQHSLSEEARDVTGIRNKASGRDFARVVQLLKLCPEIPQDGGGLRAVGIYHAILESAARMMPALRSWAEKESAGCAYFAAVALDRRIALSREMWAQDAGI